MQAQSTTKNEHVPEEPDSTKALGNIPTAIATAAGLAAESAEREAWKLLSLQIADTYMGECTIWY